VKPQLAISQAIQTSLPSLQNTPLNEPQAEMDKARLAAPRIDL
jgi:hypothetical protein